MRPDFASSSQSWIPPLKSRSLSKIVVIGKCLGIEFNSRHLHQFFDGKGRVHSLRRVHAFEGSRIRAGRTILASAAPRLPYKPAPTAASAAAPRQAGSGDVDITGTPNTSAMI